MQTYSKPSLGPTVSMCVCVCLCMYVCVCVCVCVFVCAFGVRVYVCVCVRVCTYLRAMETYNKPSFGPTTTAHGSCSSWISLIYTPPSPPPKTKKGKRANVCMDWVWRRVSRIRVVERGRDVATRDKCMGVDVGVCVCMYQRGRMLVCMHACMPARR